MDSFEDVYLAEQRRAYKLACLLCRDAATAEDVVAAAFVSSWRRWSGGTVAEFGPYLRRAVVNEAIAGFRRRAHEARRRSAQPERRAPAGPEEAVVDRQTLHEALLRLPVRQRTAVVLRYYEDLSEADIARWMSTSVGTTKAHLSRGLVALRAHLDQTRGDW